MIAGIIVWVQDDQNKTFKVSKGRLSLEEAEELIKGYCDKDNATTKGTAANPKPMVSLW